MDNPMRYVREAWRMARVLRDPHRLPDIIDLARVLAPPIAMRRMVERLMGHPATAQALVDRPRVGRLHLADLRALPEGTFGRAFADHLTTHHLDPDALPYRQAHTDEEYVRAHLLESHDIWHVLTGFGTDVAGELGLQAFALAQVGSPFALGILTGGLANTLLYAFSEREARMRAVARGWVLGQRASPLFGTPWRQYWELPLEEVRERLGLDLARVDALLAPPLLAAPLLAPTGRDTPKPEGAHARLSC
ncbi:Coq4 family protein [Myxococcus stipitatus]|uniref:Coq4 family protein n=1 Tax=Myxococcus stipitatus TaxID=83455 RepID=UPI001F4737AA|nr:Coq4 family protein [Myxococcus stipitatus]MCE9674078.1 Coq4 family protein [Myxococcus stipitatus]